MIRFNSFLLRINFAVLVLAFFSITTLKAQILIGPVVGGQVGWITFNDKSNKDYYKSKPYIGFHAGGAFSFRMQKNFYLQTSLLYSQKGKNLDGKLDQTFSNKATYRYIDMPIMFNKEFNAKFGKGKRYKWYVGAGPSISYWLSGKGVLKSSELNENTINPPNYDLPYHITFGKDPADVVQGEMNVENPNRIQLGLHIAGGVIFEPVGLNKFMVTVRYELGHSYLSPDSKGDFGLGGQLFYKDDLQIRNQGLALSLYYFIDLKTDERNRGKSTLNINKIKKKKK